MCSFHSDFRLKVFLSGSGYREKVLSLAQVSNPACVCFTGSGLRDRVLLDCSRAMSHRSTVVRVSQSQSIT